MKLKDLQGKTAIITGAGRGIGLCIAKTFLEAGANAVIAEADEKLGKKAIDFLKSQNVLFCKTDAADENSVKAIIQQTIEKFSRIDFLINNAAVMKNIPLTDLSYSDWKRVIDVNLSAAFLCAKYCCNQLKKTKGAIVNIASTRALMSEPDTEPYSASKGGIAALTHALAISLAPEVRVNCISPGWINTAEYLHGAPPPWKIRPEDHSQHPAGRVGRPEDIAEMALYLCSPRAGFITGQNFVIDGGMTKKMIYIE